MKPVRKVAALIVLTGAVVMAQRKVDIHNMYERVVCVVPIVGKGTFDDPRRPQFAPLQTKDAVRSNGIIGFSWVPSDDGQFAIVEFVARERSAFQAIKSAARADVRVFEKGRDARSSIESEFKKHRKSFSLDELRTVVP